MCFAVGTADVGSGAVAVEQPGAIAAIVAGSMGAGRRQPPGGVVVAPGFFVFVAGRIDR